MTGTKIGILTFHRCINYGSYWQARSLAEGLQLRGYNATLLDHYCPWVNRAEWRCALQPVLPTPVPRTDYPLYKEKIRRFFEAFESLPLSKPFPLHQPQEMEDYNAVVVGSDEVWNRFHPWYNNCSLFFGEGIRTQKLIAYAASFGNYPAEWGLDATWAAKLSNFDAIAVRDENSRQHIQHALQQEPTLVLDPCLQFSATHDVQDMIHLPQRYIAVYGHNFSDSFIEALRTYARAAQLPIISIGYRNDWADEQWLTAGPHQFAQFMQDANSVATNFFHGCVFALKNKKPFVCETSSYRSFKVQGLMAKLGSEAHLITPRTPAATIAELLQAPLSEKIGSTIAALRRQSDVFLDRALNVNQLQVA